MPHSFRTVLCKQTTHCEIMEMEGPVLSQFRPSFELMTETESGWSADVVEADVDCPWLRYVTNKSSSNNEQITRLLNTHIPPIYLLPSTPRPRQRHRRPLANPLLHPRLPS